jgi:phosphatidate cytidylyltransferase
MLLLVNFKSLITRLISSLFLIAIIYYTYTQESIIFFGLFLCVYLVGCFEIIQSIKKLGRVLLLFLLTANLFLVLYHVLILNNKFFLFFIIYIAALHDTGGYIIGSLVGRNRIIPVISPKKTFEGFLGSIGLSIIGLKIISDIFPLSCYTIDPVNYILYPLLCFLGDILCSHIKRINKIKDFSALIPGHGGIMDRLDSTLLISWYLHILFIYC